MRVPTSINYKCINAYNALIALNKKFSIDMTRMYGVPSHGKCEIDSAGGHLKEALRKRSIAFQEILFNTTEAAEILQFNCEKNPGAVKH